MTDLLGEDESVDLVDIRYVDFKGNEKKLIVTNKEEIKKIVEMPYNMNLKRNSAGFAGADEGIYILSLKTEKQRYSSIIMHLSDNGGMTVNEDSNAYNFRIVGKNPLLEALESFEYVIPSLVEDDIDIDNSMDEKTKACVDSNVELSSISRSILVYFYFECLGSEEHPYPFKAVLREVNSGETVESRIEYAVKQLIQGPTKEEIADGFISIFNEETS